MWNVDYIINNIILGWPFIIFVVVASIWCTIQYRFVQCKYFFRSWKLALAPSESGASSSEASMTPLQAFINSLGMSLGNGAVAGVATSIYVGGPGSIFWLVVAGLLLMSVRFAEVYLSIYYSDVRAHIGGPITYLKKLPCGGVWASLYAFFALMYALVVGNAIQMNAISISLQTMASVPPIIVAGAALLFVLYVMFGGASRILSISSAIVPCKVALFFVSTIALILYHWQEVIPAIVLITKAAFSVDACFGAAVGYSVQCAMRAGILRTIMATEAGLGTSGILFGSSGSIKPMEDSIMSMLTVFISTVACFLVGLCIVVSGVTNSGLTSTALVIASFESMFGVLAGPIVTILAVSFGMGLIVSYGFIARSLWLYIMAGRYEMVGNLVYGMASVAGALCNAHILWVIGDIINSGMMVLNIGAIIFLSGTIRTALSLYKKR